jgi:hypothetical protein
MRFVFFEMDGRVSICQHHSQMSGNPVRIGDGYATVTGYKLPQPLAFAGKAGVRFEARSQDIGLPVLVRSRKGPTSP